MRTLKLITVSLLGLSLVAPGGVLAQDADTLAEIEETLGMVPSHLQVYPASALEGGWALVLNTDLNQDMALDPKVRELVSLAVAAQVPCQYCIYYHTKAAEAQGATQEEIREAVLMSALVRHWSTILQGNSYDMEAFVAEVDTMFAPK